MRRRTSPCATNCAARASLRVIHNRTSRFALDEARTARAWQFFVQGPDRDALVRRPRRRTFIPVAKSLVDAAKKKGIEVRGGYVEGELLDAAGVVALAKSPDKPTLRAMLLGAINGSARGHRRHAAGSG